MHTSAYPDKFGLSCHSASWQLQDCDLDTHHQKVKECDQEIPQSHTADRKEASQAIYSSNTSLRQ